MLAHCPLKVNPGVSVGKVEFYWHCAKGEGNWIGRISFIYFSCSCLSKEIDIVSAAQCVVDNANALSNVIAPPVGHLLSGGLETGGEGIVEGGPVRINLKVTYQG